MEVGRKVTCLMNFSDDDIEAFYTGYAKLDELSDILSRFDASGHKKNLKIEIQDKTDGVVETISLKDISRALTVFECFSDYPKGNFKINVVFENEGEQLTETNFRVSLGTIE